MLFLQTAWKNLFRYKRRTFITSIAIAVGVMCSITVEGLLYGMTVDSNRNIVWYESGAAKVFAKEYFENKDFFPTDYLIEKSDREELEKFFKSEQVRFTPRYITTGDAVFTEEYFPASGSVNVIIVGVDSMQDKSVFHVEQSVNKGTWISPNDSGIVMGSWLAQDIDADLNYVMTIECKGRGGFYQTFDVAIKGFVLTNSPKTNKSYVFMDLAYLNEMLLLEDAVTEYSIAFDAHADLSLIETKYPKLKKNIDTLASIQKNDMQIYSWKEINADVLSMMKSQKTVSNLMLLLIFIIAAVGISNTMLMAVMERKQEIAMLKTLGYSSMQVTSLFVYEGFFIGLIGSIIGLILGIIGVLYLIINGIDFSNIIQNMNVSLRISGIVHAAWDFYTFLKIALLALFVSAISAYFPTRKMLKKEISELFK